MRVAEITGEPILYGGQEKFIANLVQNIDCPDITIDVITPHYCNNNGFCELIEKQGGKVYELNLPFLPGKSRRLLLKPLTAFLRNTHYDAVHIHSGSISALAYIAKASRTANIKRIIVHSHSSGLKSLKHSVIRKVFGRTLKRSATDFLACSYEAGAMKYPDDIVKSKMVIINNGIQIRDYNRVDKVRNKIREELRIPEYAYTIGHVGRFTYEKNHDFLIRLFKEYRKTDENSVLLLLGDGELAEKVRTTVTKEGLDSSVIFTGNVDAVQNYYQAMDTFVLPSLYEGFPFVLLEAQAAGLPSIISTGIPEEAIIGKNVKRIGLDVNEWISALKEFRNTEVTDNYTYIKNAGYDIRETAEQIKQLYIDTI